jgi:hypothetical protein
MSICNIIEEFLKKNNSAMVIVFDNKILVRQIHNCYYFKNGDVLSSKLDNCLFRPFAALKVENDSRKSNSKIKLKNTSGDCWPEEFTKIR